jgi:hypothetical protein
MDLKTLSRNAGTVVKRLLFDPEQVSKLDPPCFKLLLTMAGVPWGLLSLESFSFLSYRFGASVKRPERVAVQCGQFGS